MPPKFFAWIHRILSPPVDTSLSSTAHPWKALFEGIAELTGHLEQSGEALQQFQQHSILELQDHLGQAYQQYSKLEKGYSALILGMIETVDLCDQLAKKQEGVDAVRSRLLAVLDQQGIVLWIPEIGQTVIDGCIVVQDVPAEDLPSNTVAAVVMPGYRRSDGWFIRGAQVLRAVAPSCQEDQLQPGFATDDVTLAESMAGAPESTSETRSGGELS